MKWVFRKNLLNCRSGFTLVEVTAALIILGMITATVLVVANRAIDTVVLWQTKIEAFEIARENMEKVLASSSVTDMVEYGVSERNPDINWETTVESFYEPMTENMWIRAICSAGFIDASGEEQEIELVHWISSVSKKQIEQILEQQERQDAYYMTMMAASGSGASGLPQDLGSQGDMDPQTDPDPQSDQDPQPQQDQPEVGKPWDELIGLPPEQFWKKVMEILKNR